MNRADNRRSRRAYSLSLVALFFFSCFTIADAAIRGSRDVIISASFFVFCCFLIVILHRLRRVVSEAFFIPLVLYLAHSCASYLTGNYWDYFFICLGICCLGALFNNSREFLKFFILSNMITGLQIMFGIFEFNFELLLDRKSVV